MVVHLAVGMRGPPTPIVMVMEMMMVMFFALRSDCPPLRSQKGADPTQKASNMPEWNQAHRAHQQTKHGVESPTQLRTAWCTRCFKNEREQKTIHKTEFADQARAST